MRVKDIDILKPHTLQALVEAADDAGTPENAVTLFDPFYEWNAMSY